MGERKFTFVEYHSHGSGPSFFPDLLTPSATAAEESEEPEEAEAEDEDDEGGGRAIRVVLALIVLIGVAAAVKYFMGGDEEGDEPFETQEVAVTEYED